jgi:hypothetical protein
MSSQADAMKRLEALEAQNRVDEQGPLLERLSAATDISVAEIMAESQRVSVATAHLTYRQQLEWIASDCGMSVSELEDAANALLAAE